MTKHYVLGFAFDLPNDGEDPVYVRNNISVALIRKNRPEWQAGQWNGIGGKIEEGESAHDAMVREFDEETGLFVDGWDRFCVMRGPTSETHRHHDGYIMHAFRTFDVPLHALETTTDEVVDVWKVRELPEALIPHVDWLVRMALHPGVQMADIKGIMK